MIIEQRLTETYEVIKRQLRYQAITPLILTLATTFSLRDENFNVKKYNTLKEEVKKQTGIFSYLRSNIGIVLPYLMAQPNEAQAVQQLLNNYECLIEHKFVRSNFSYLAATYVQDEAHVERAYAYYTALRNYHPFLTTQDDTPYAVLLTIDAHDVEERATMVHHYVKALVEQGYYKGNDLLWLAQILTIDTTAYQPERIEAVLRVEQQLKRQGIKKKQRNYVLIGILAFLDYNDTQIAAIINLAKTIEKLPQYKWYKQYALYSAVQITLYVARSDLHDKLSATLLTAIETAVQSQQLAATIALSNSTNHS